jgi:phage terminase large subunit
VSKAEFPAAFNFLFAPARYKCAYGGRGAGKSQSFARALLILGAEKPMRILCTREVQRSILDSVWKLLSDQIAALGLSHFYRVEKSKIYGANGTEFIFSGLRDVNAIKSYENIAVAWIEEGQAVTKHSFETLTPSIRAKDSEIWVSFNPDVADAFMYQRFVVKPPPDAIVRKVNYDQNPWFPEVLRKEMEYCKATDPDAYLNIWEGHPRQTLDGAIYANEMRALTAAGRITRVPYDPALPVHTFWDLGISDCTSIWFAQAAAFEFRAIDFLQDRNRALPHYLQLLQQRGYVYGYHHLPHDGQRRDLGTGKSIERLMTEAGFKVKIVPNIGFANGLNSARNLFARIWVDEEKCADGLNCLRRYCWKVDPVTRVYSKEPVHDDFSHGSDAWRMMGVALTEPQRAKEAQKRRLATHVSAWS